MKTIVAFSDSHEIEIPYRALSVMGESDFIFFAGDGLYGVRHDLCNMADKLYAVRGNCDGVRGDDECVVSVEDVKFLIVHGNRCHGKTDLCYRAKELGCNAVIYGHTHIFDDDLSDGVRLINTGSLSRSPTFDVGYSYIVVNGKNIFVNFTKLN